MKKYCYNILFCAIKSIFFSEHKLVVEVDAKGHIDRDKEKETKRQKAIEEQLGCESIRNNHYKEDFDMDIGIGEIYNHIIESTKN